jgi:hypothetical protein
LQSPTLFFFFFFFPVVIAGRSTRLSLNDTTCKKEKEQISNRRFENWKLFSFVFYRRKTFKTSFAVAWNSLAGLSSFFFLFRWGLFISNKKRKERKNERKKEEEKKDMEANGFNSRLSIAFCGRAHT